MAGHTVSIDFWIDPLKIQHKDEREIIVKGLIPIVQPFSGTLNLVGSHSLPKDCYLYIYASEEMTLTVKMYANGLVTGNLEYFAENVNEHKIVIDDGRQIEKLLQEKFAIKTAKCLPAVKRAPPVNPYFTTSDDRILEYDVESIVFEKKSQYQKVQIYNIKSLGNMLVLDELQNLSEQGLVYTHGLMNKDAEDYKGKHILILGGGDGALLWELLKEKPAYVTMIELDEVVIRACRKHMRSVCGDCMDQLKGENYEIIIGDAIEYMKRHIKEGREFDYVFGDLTDIPISEEATGQFWQFLTNIVQMGAALLKPCSGKYMTHATGIQCDKALSMFEEEVRKLPIKLSINRTNCYVPCFLENWCFYQLQRLE